MDTEQVTVTSTLEPVEVVTASVRTVDWLHTAEESLTTGCAAAVAAAAAWASGPRLRPPRPVGRIDNYVTSQPAPRPRATATSPNSTITGTSSTSSAVRLPTSGPTARRPSSNFPRPPVIGPAEFLNGARTSRRHRQLDPRQHGLSEASNAHLDLVVHHPLRLDHGRHDDPAGRGPKDAPGYLYSLLRCRSRQGGSAVALRRGRGHQHRGMRP